jgi:diacylglycerol kinase family enzyme
MRALVVANPAATTTTGRVRDVLVGALASELKVDLAETTHRGHARELGRQALADGVDVVVALGGDGTVNEVVNGLLTDGPGAHVPTLAVVPGGSTNVFSRALGRSRDPVEATGEILDSLRSSRTRRISLGTASATGTSTAPLRPTDPGTAAAVAEADAAADDGWTDPRWFVFAAGLGFDADVISRVEAQRARGRRSTGALYVREATRAFVLGRERRRPAMTLSVPGSDDLDGLFLCLVSNVSPWTYLGARPVNPCPEASCGCCTTPGRCWRAVPTRAAGACTASTTWPDWNSGRRDRRAGSSTATTSGRRPGCASSRCPRRSASSPDRRSGTSRGLCQGPPRCRVAALARPW